MASNDDDDISVSADDADSSTPASSSSASTSSTAAAPGASGTGGLDPNQIVKPGATFDVWIAPGWSDYVIGGTQKQRPPGAGADWTWARARTVTYANGRKVTQVLDASGQPHPQPLKEEVDPDVKKIWDADVKAANAKSTTAPPGGKPYIDEEGPSGRRLGWNPKTGQYDRDLGSSPQAQAAAAGKSSREPVQIGGKNLIKVTTVNGGQSEVHYEDTSGNKVDPPVETKPTTVATDTTEPFIVTRQPDGSLTSEKNPNYKGPETKPGTNLTVKGGDGKTYIVPIDGTGKAGTPKDLGIPGEADNLPPASATGWTPDPKKPAYGLVERFQDLMQRVQKGELTRPQAQAAYEQDQAVAKAYAGQLQQSAQTAAGVYGNEVSQRNTDVGTVNNRLQAASQGFQTAVNTGMKLNADLPQGSDLGGKAIIGLMALNAANARGMGGMKDIPHATVPPALQQMMTMTLPNGVKLDVPMAPGAGAPAAPGMPASPVAPPMPVTPSAPPVRDDWNGQPQGMTDTQPGVFGNMEQIMSGIVGPDVVAEANRQIQAGLGLG